MEKNLTKLKKNFGSRLKKVRLDNNLSQDDLGSHLGYKNPRSDISNIENGRKFPSIEKLIQISEILNISIDYLLKGNNNKL